MSTFIPSKGVSIYKAIREAQTYMYHAKLDWVDIQYDGLEVTVTKTSNPNDTAYIYELLCELRDLKAKYENQQTNPGASIH